MINKNHIYARPYQGAVGNNRKLTLCRRIEANKIQSIPMFEKTEGRTIKFLGFKYIKH